MNFQDAKAEMIRFYEGDEILRVFRGSVTKAAEAGQQFVIEHPRIQKTVHYQTLRAGLKGEDIRVPVFEALVDLHCEVSDKSLSLTIACMRTLPQAALAKGDLGKKKCGSAIRFKINRWS